MPKCGFEWFDLRTIRELHPRFLTVRLEPGRLGKGLRADCNYLIQRRGSGHIQSKFHGSVAAFTSKRGHWSSPHRDRPDRLTVGPPPSSR